MNDNLPSELWIAFDAFGTPRNYWDAEYYNENDINRWRIMGFTILKFTRSEEAKDDTQDA